MEPVIGLAPTIGLHHLFTKQGHFCYGYTGTTMSQHRDMHPAIYITNVVHRFLCFGGNFSFVSQILTVVMFLNESFCLSMCNI